MQLNKYWIIVSLVTIFTIFIFVHFSNKLESYVTDSLIENQEVSHGLK